MLAGLLIGLFIGLAVAIGVAIYVNRAPSPFTSKSKPGEPVQPQQPANKTVASVKPDATQKSEISTKPEAPAKSETPVALSLPAKPEPPVVLSPPAKPEPPTVSSAPVKPEAPMAQPAPAKPDVPGAEKTAKPLEKQRFEFYDILQGKEAPATEQEVKASAAQKPGLKPKVNYFLQAGSFPTEADADNLKARLALLGVEVVVQTAAIPEKGVWHRVRVGPYTGIEELNKARTALANVGIQAALIKIHE